MDTPISKILNTLRGRNDAVGGKVIDFVVFFKLDQDQGERYFDPINIDSEVDLNSHIILKIEMQGLLNMQFEMAGFSSEQVSQWHEE